MKIENLKQKGKSENYIVTFDNNFTYILTLETILKNHLSIGKVMDEDDFAGLIYEDQKITGFEKAITLLTKTFKTEKQIRKYLKDKFYCKDAIDNIVNKLKEYKYLNDEEYAKSFISTYENTKGKLWLKQELYLKGVDEKIISKYLSKVENQEEAIDKLAEKFLKNKERDIKTKEKLLRHLLSKGFTYEEVKNIVNKKFKGKSDDWN